MQNHDIAFFAVIVCLPLLVRLLMVPRIGAPVRAASVRIGERLWAQLLDAEEPDEVVLRRWALVNLGLLEEHLARVRQLVLTDDEMSATRQLGNRLAYERLESDVARAAANAPERIDEPSVVTTRWQPTTQVRYLPTPAAAQPGSVEVLELGPSGRWF